MVSVYSIYFHEWNKVLEFPLPRNYPGTMACFLAIQQIGMFYQGKTHIFSISEMDKIPCCPPQMLHVWNIDLHHLPQMTQM